ncbi:RagB/SusD family nutrient uptake outer membrane protein [Pedobacter petrophilus]|uniref:RagB/SusD family nutrient uptake outer membrane protein n=1 Tax=Pedobacter petrophilus TaxID=1908241 RepID=A0A7K0G2C9_9SPHI|nr:RagB/SusD family nutrient uptake outer membrane protein [Pedobacter petrophilus]MRX77977.1 RagB/SusD family nutrient uptake outer membrane protein [Pedobacter petrophilus]
MKIETYLTLFSFLLILVSCEKQLDQTPESSLATDNFFTNNNDFLQAVNGVYSQLNNYPSQALWLSEMRSDNINATSDGNRDWDGINNFTPNITTTGFITTAWRANFNGIYNANTVLEALQTKAGALSASNAIRYAAEVRFLRAFYYFSLVRTFGQVPLISTVKSAAEVASIPRSPVADVYALIESDLQFAATNLPATFTGIDLGRPTAAAAKGLLGLVYLTKSGPTYGINGPGLNSNEYDKAAALFDQVITGSPFNFGSGYANIFSYTNENNSEVVFDIQFASSLNGAGFPSHLAPVAYWTSSGISNSFGNGYGSSTFPVSKSLVNAYTTNTVSGTDLRYPFNVATTYAPGPFIKKYIDVPKRGLSGRDWSINFIVLRYTDILLMKAECILHGATGSQADVDAIVNRVRARAGVGPLANVTLATLMQERQREFLGEGLRWNDLVRSGLAITQMNAWRNADGMTKVNEIVPDYIIYPVPAAEIQTAPGLYTQNPGYN